jgi:hypothetical protein
MRDYGWMVTDTSGWAASFQLSGGANPAAAQAWRALRIDTYGADLLFGLFTKARMWTVEPAHELLRVRTDTTRVHHRSLRVPVNDRGTSRVARRPARSHAERGSARATPPAPFVAQNAFLTREGWPLVRMLNARRVKLCYAA